MLNLFHRSLAVWLSLFAVVLAEELASRDKRPEGDAATWKLSSFEDFSAGQFGDAGANTYVSASGRVQLVNRWDLNNDGYIDLVFANSHPHVEKLDAVIFWGNGRDFDGSRTTPVANEGAQWTVATDLNDDGRIDVVIPNYTNGTWSKMDSYVYYGGEEKGSGGSDAGSKHWSMPPFTKKTTLPTEAAQSAAVGDLNKDGHPDIVFSLSAGFWEYRGSASALASPTRIFWGSDDGYKRENFQDIEAMGASDVAIADLNKDGWLDVVLANREKNKKFDVNSYIYWGGEKGISPDRRVELPTNQANAVTIGDVNKDGLPDVVFANGLGTSSYVYLNKDGSFSADDRIELPTSDARDCAVADLNGDGFAEVFFTNHQTANNFAILSSLYWGGREGFSPDRRQQFETLGAWGVSLADLNEDGLPDIVVSNYREGVSHEVPSYIFWNSKSGFSDSRRTSLFTRGAVGNTVADFNGDGHLDVMFNNTVGRTRGGPGPLYVYWGREDGQYSPERRLELPSVEPYEWAAGDMNDDGWTDLLVVNMAEVGRRITENFIYWGDANGLSESRRSALVATGARGGSLADLDRDGYLDVILFCSAPADPGVIIYWGDRDGFVVSEREELPGAATGVPAVADLNADGNLDLIVPGALPEQGTSVFWGDGKRNYSNSNRLQVPGSAGVTNSEVADIDRDGHLDLILTRRGMDPSFIYYGDSTGEFSIDRRSEFTPLETQGVTVGDLDQDGWLDIVAPTYKNKGSRATLSKVFWGSATGISDDNALELPTNAGTGSQIADYNGDGHNDLLLICHRAEGDPSRVGVLSDHVTDSYLFWGGPKGVQAGRKLLIPSRGAHYDSGVDMGNISDRALQFDYVSPAHHYGKQRPERLEWTADTPHGSQVQFQTRTAATEEALAEASWTGPQGPDSYYQESGASLRAQPNHGWIQLRAILSTPNVAASPSLDEVTVSFAPASPSVN